MAQPTEPFSEATPWWRIGVAPDQARSENSPVVTSGYTRFSIEYDDQGCSYDRSQVTALMDKLDELRGSRPIILVFVHGWKHNARDQDEFLASFDRVLEQTAEAERLVTSSGAPGPGQPSKQGEQAGRPRHVIGVFVGWRGLSFYWNLLTNLTFWNRKTTALRVSLGAVRELMGRLRHYRAQENGEPVLVIVGHSMGAQVVYQAVAQSLIENAAIGDPGVFEPGFADLVMLVNPAFEASQYLPIYYAVKHRTFAHGQPPIFISITGTNDQATGTAFPIGAWLATRWQHTRTSKQKDALIHTVGFVKWMKTHEVYTEPNASKNTSAPPSQASPTTLAGERFPSDASYGARTPGWIRHFDGGAILKQVEKDPEGRLLDPNNPFWIIQAAPTVIQHHNGIFGEVFLGFIRKLVAEQLR